MLYAVHLKRSIDRLTLDAWERLLTAHKSEDSPSKQILTSCPCCGRHLCIGLAVAALPAGPTSTLAPQFSVPVEHDALGAAVLDNCSPCMPESAFELIGANPGLSNSTASFGGTRCSFSL